MQGEESDVESVFVDHFDRWLRNGLTGCGFANSMAGEGRVDYVDQLDELSASDIPSLNESIDTSGSKELFLIVLFPRVRTPRGIVRLLQALSTNDRWRARRVQWDKNPRTGVTPVGLEYRAAGGEISSVMGLAPLGCMPITRRAPYVALAAYAGPKINSHRGTGKGELGFIDARMFAGDGKEISKEAHDKIWKPTMARVKSLSQDPIEDHFWLAKVAFFLADELVADWLKD